MSEAQTVGTAVAEVQAAPTMIEQAQAAWAEVLPAQVGVARYRRWALNLLQRPELVEVARTPQGKLSIMTALLDCASLGLEPGRTYHLVPFKGTVHGITDYKGEIELIHNASPHASVVAQLVRQGDQFTMTGANIPPQHDADWFGDRGPVIGGYAYMAYDLDRFSQVVRMSETDFLVHRAKAQTVKVWDEWPEAMRLKTLVHQLRKWVPWSAETRG